MTRAERIGFFGLGIMGSRMAANLARAGYQPGGLDPHPGQGRGVGAGARRAVRATPAGSPPRADVVVSMVVDGAQVESVLLGEHGAIEAPRPGLL